MPEQSTFLWASNQPGNEANIKLAVTEPSILKTIPLEAKQYSPIPTVSAFLRDVYKQRVCRSNRTEIPCTSLPVSTVQNPMLRWPRRATFRLTRIYYYRVRIAYRVSDSWRPSGHIKLIFIPARTGFYLPHRAGLWGVSIIQSMIPWRWVVPEQCLQLGFRALITCLAAYIRPHPLSCCIYTALIPCFAACILPSSPVLLHIYCTFSLLFGTVIINKRDVGRGYACYYSCMPSSPILLHIYWHKTRCSMKQRQRIVAPNNHNPTIKV